MEIKGLSTKGRKTHLYFIWMSKCEKAFQNLKNAFIKASILAHFILKQHLYFKTNSLDHINIGVFSQIDDNGLFYLVIFYLSKLTP